MKKTKMLIVIFVMMDIVIAGLSVASYAAETSVTGTPTSLTITREVNNVTNPVTNTFTYTVEADASNPAAVTDLPTGVQVVFNNVSPTSNKATATGTLDMSGVKFTALGDYKFKVTETASQDGTTYPVDSAKTYYVYVSVRNELDNNNVPTGNLIATLAEQSKLSDTGEKVDIKYNSAAKLTYIQLSKSVTGNMAKTDDYFEFTLTIPGTTGDVYVISGNHSTDGNTTVATSNYTVGTTTKIYLKHGQTVTIGKSGDLGQIKVGSEYTITESNTKSYTSTTVDGTSGTTTTKTMVATDNSDFDDDNVTAFINHKEASVLTGVFANVAPFAVLVALAVIGLYAIKKTSNN